MNTCIKAVQGRNQTREGLESTRIYPIGECQELSKHFSIYSDTLAENVCLKARIETLREVMNWDICTEYKC